MIYNREMTATVYIIDDTKVLLHMHKKYNTWFPVGGHIEPHELPDEAAVREAYEESGFEVELYDNSEDTKLNIVKCLPVPEQIYVENLGKENENVDFIYAARIVSGKLHPGENESCVFKWFSESELINENKVKPHIRNTALAILNKYSGISK